jgi:hypothetical protein
VAEAFKREADGVDEVDAGAHQTGMRSEPSRLLLIA